MRHRPARPTWRSLIAAAVAALALALTISASPAAAQETIYSHLGTFGGHGTASGQFNRNPMPQRLAAYDQGELIFVADRGNNRVQAFTQTSSGVEPVFSIAVPAPIGLAVDQTNGDLYVSTVSNIRKLNPDDPADPTEYSVDADFVSPAIGSGVGQIGALHTGDTDYPASGGLAVDPTDSSLLVLDVSRNRVQRFDADGGFDSSFDGCATLFNGVCFDANRPAFTGVRDIAVTATGDIYVAEVTSTGARLDRFDRDGEHKAILSRNNDPVPNPNLAPPYGSGVVITVDRDSGDVYMTSTTATWTAPAPTYIYRFEDDDVAASFTAPSDFSGYIHGMTMSSGTAKRLYVMAGAIVPMRILNIFTEPSVHMFEQVIPTSVEFDSIASITATTAEFSGKVNPNGGQAHWTFRYRQVGTEQWQQAPEPPEGPELGEDYVEISATATGLQPNSDYEVKLVGLAGSVPTETAVETFRTEPEAPDVDSGAGTFLGDTTATLSGGINPRNAEVTYHFEWGIDDSYGEVAPVPDGTVEPAADRVTVTAKLTGLHPSREYHFRLVATNEFGQTMQGDDRVFTTLPDSREGLQPERGYEMVADPPTGGIRIMSGHSRAAEDGERAMYRIAFNDPLPPGTEVPHRRYAGQRGNDRWSVFPIERPDPAELSLGLLSVGSPDFSRFIVETRLGLDPDDENGAGDLYRMEPDGSLTWITRSELVEPGKPQEDSVSILGFGGRMSTDGLIGAFISQRRLTAEDPFPSGAGARLYSWSGEKLSFLSVLADATPVSGFVAVNHVSRDGSVIVWSQAQDGVGSGSKVYARVDGNRVVQAGEGTFIAAADDGSRIILLDDGHLFSIDTGTGVRKQIDRGAAVVAAMDVSANADTVYFSSNEVLATERSPLGKHPVEGSRNIYLAELDQASEVTEIRFVASVGTSGGTSEWSAVSPDGAVLAFGTTTNLTGSTTGGYQQLYVYDDLAHALRCASCPPPGTQPISGNINAQILAGGEDITSSNWHHAYLIGGKRRFVGSDGTVFFTTKTPLLPGDENSVRDVYEFRGGELRLVSSGAWSAGPSTFEDASIDGTTAFIATGSALDPRDDEPDVTKLYAVRVGGGFPPPDPPAPECVADDCQGPSAGPPAPLRLGSEGLGGEGNVKAQRQATPDRLRISRIRRAAGPVARLRVRVPEAGRVAVTGPKVRGVSRSAPRAGNVILRVVLKPRMRRVLRSRGRLAVGVRVRYRAAGGAQAATRARVVFENGRRARSNARNGGRS